MKKFLSGFLNILTGFGFVLAYAVYIVCKWSVQTFGIGIEEIIFTMTSPLNGSDSNVLNDALSMCVPRLLMVIVAYIILSLVLRRIRHTYIFSIVIKKFNFNLSVKKLVRITAGLLSVFSIVLSVLYVDNCYALFDYLTDKNSRTTIYEDYYVDPNNANIRLKKEKKNLIYIYVESMETTYTSVENGGKQDICYIPNLSSLAEQNISFSNSEKLGGFNNTTGTTYTMGALLGSTSGVPFAFPTGYNSMDTRESFASGLTTLGDILDDFGYNNEFLCGSDASFAGRRIYFTQHGNYKIFDYYTAKEKGYIPEDYYVFWGYEDMRLFEIAKDEITALSKEDKPFNLTMLTVDTHHVSGYVCDICRNDYDMQTKNVVSCVDRQVTEFVNWCQQQDFYKDTVIIVTGDHPRMDNDMVENVDYFDRTMYNCYINCEDIDNSALNTVNRTFTALDLFPTTLSALGFEWDGNRLGLGTDMFSSEKTLAEQLGYDYLNDELAKKSSYYIKFY